MRFIFKKFIFYSLASALLSSVASHQLAATEIYYYKDSKGRVQLTDRPPHKGFHRVIDRDWMHKPMASLDTANFPRNKKRYTPLINRAAEHYRVNAALLNAVVTAESAYDPKAVSKAGAVGLMQLMPATAERYGTTDRYNPKANVDAGTRYLRDLLKQFRDTRLALAAYNAGENNVIKYGYKIPPFKETRQYVQKVMHYYEKYQAAM